MNWPSWLLSAFLATLTLSVILNACQGLGLTRMNLPYLIGTFFSPQRERARLYGSIVHLLNGWAVSVLYVLIFQDQRLATWWFGALLGLAHALVVLTVGMSVMPGIHPRMASEHRGPTTTRQLEPPGFMALHYGVQTPVSIFIAHAAFGAILGALYHLA